MNHVAESSWLIFKNVTVIDMKAGVPKSGMTVVIHRNRIVATGSSAVIRTISIPKNALTIDGHRKFLLPAFWDMHVHLGTEDFDKNSYLPLFIANGVTSIRIMDGEPEYHQWREERESNPNRSLIQATGGDEAYVQQILSDNRVRRIDNNGFDADRGAPAFNQQRLAFMRLFENIHMNQDPLRQYFMESHDYTLIPVAAAGNFKWKRPFYPAQWQEVLAVSATIGIDGDLWALSNNGEVSAAGAYFLFDDEIYRAGTSFAAPVVSLMQAIDLSNDSPACGLANNGRSEMASHGQWRDLPLLEAVEERC
jgi:hypothetical protein